MDISNLDTRAAASRGAFLHLVHPGFDPKHDLWHGDVADDMGRLKEGADPKDEDRVGLWLKGMEDKKVSKAYRKLQKATEAHPGNPEAYEVRQATVEFLQEALIEFQNLSTGGKGLTKDKEDIEAFLNMSTDFTVQIVAFMIDRANFFTESGAPSSAPKATNSDGSPQSPKAK